MLDIGQMCWLITIQNPITTTDDMGSPVLAWADYMQVYSAIENDQYIAEEANSAPHEMNTQNRTYIIRNHSGLQFTTQQRILDGTSTFAIQAIRYDSKKTICYIDALSGAASG